MTFAITTQPVISLGGQMIHYTDFRAYASIDAVPFNNSGTINVTIFLILLKVDFDQSPELSMLLIFLILQQLLILLTQELLVLIALMQ